MIAASQGNTELLNFSKTSFLCSRKIPASAVLNCYDWAIYKEKTEFCYLSIDKGPKKKVDFEFEMQGLYFK
jgi:hypothetical protein